MIVYKITNTINGKIYIGKTTKSLMERWNRHCLGAFNYNVDSFLANALRKYGRDAFSIEIIKSFDTIEHLNHAEVFYIKRFQSANPVFGYNLTHGGEGVIPTPESRKRLSVAMHKYRKTATHRHNLSKSKLGRPGPWKGKKGHPQSELTRKKMSFALKGKRKSMKTRERMRIAWQLRKQKSRI